MDLPGGTRASALDPAGRGTKGFGRRCLPKVGRGASASKPPRRTARASALTGSPRGNRKEASASDGPRRTRDLGLAFRGLRPGFRPSKPPGAGGLASAGSSATGKWGPAAMPAPIIFGPIIFGPIIFGRARPLRIPGWGLSALESGRSRARLDRTRPQACNWYMGPAIAP